MTAGERGFALLCSHLGDPARRPLTTAQLRTLTQRMRTMSAPWEDRELEPRDLIALGFGPEEARRIIGLLAQEDVLDHYLAKARRIGCEMLTRISPDYPQALRSRMGEQAPGILWYRGDKALLSTPMVALVGSRGIRPDNAEFAAQAGQQAAAQGFTLVSGNARGADQIAQDACLAAGGSVISVLADSLRDHEPGKNQLLLSEDCFDLPFSPQRALSRNRVIHALPLVTLVAQAEAGAGGTWDGTVKNLKYGWSPVCCFDDRSEGAARLAELGAEPIGIQRLCALHELTEPPRDLFHM